MIIRPRIIKDERYALAMPVDGEETVIIQTYHNLEQLETGYADWKEITDEIGTAPFVPVERLDEKGNCKILEDILQSD